MVSSNKTETEKVKFSLKLFPLPEFGQTVIFPETRSRQFYHTHLQYLRLKTYNTEGLQALNRTSKLCS